MSKNHHHSSHFPPPLRRTTTTSAKHHSTPPAPPPTTTPNLTTTVYHTAIGLFALTWSRNVFGRSLHLHHSFSGASSSDDTLSSPPHSFHLHIKPFIFWNKKGSKKLPNNIQIFWDLSKAKFGSGPEPLSRFYIAVLVNGEMTLLAGDSPKQAYGKTKSTDPNKTQITVLRREHVYGIWNKQYTTKACFGGQTRNVTIDCRVRGDDSKLYFAIDNKRALQIKHLKWKFRGNERIEFDGAYVQVSWDVHNWLFEEERESGYALFMFRFEKSGFEYSNHEDDDGYFKNLDIGSGSGFGFEARKMKKSGLLRRARSSSSSSLSSASSSCGSVMEWESVEENELKGPSGFSLLVYAWKS